MTEVSVFCLSLHAEYSCRHSGACCRTWEVAAEPEVVEFVRRRYGAGTAGRAFKNDADSAQRVRIAHADGACFFRQQDRCTLHAQGGAAALPVGCRHFPRVILRDPRGTFVALSHYCPTAAALLTTDAELGIVEATSSLRLCEPLEGLDARGALPPLLRPGMLTDYDGYDAWERSVIGVFDHAHSASIALDAIDVATEEIRWWSPGQESLQERVHASFADAQSAKPERRRTNDAGWELRLVADLSNGAIETAAQDALGKAWSAAGGDAPEIQRLVLRYLAARTFGNWLAYQGRGLRTIVAWLRACHDVLRIFALEGDQRLTASELLSAVRRTDLLMLHSLESLAFGRAAARLELPAA